MITISTQSVRPSVRPSVPKQRKKAKIAQKTKQKHTITLRGAWWVTNFARLVTLFFEKVILKGKILLIRGLVRVQNVAVFEKKFAIPPFSALFWNLWNHFQLIASPQFCHFFKKSEFAVTHHAFVIRVVVRTYVTVTMCKTNDHIFAWAWWVDFVVINQARP